MRSPGFLNPLGAGLILLASLASLTSGLSSCGDSAEAEELRRAAGEAMDASARFARSSWQSFQTDAADRFDALEQGPGLPDVVVNNAGVEAGVDTYVTLEESGWDAVLDTNLEGAWLVSRCATQ